MSSISHPPQPPQTDGLPNCVEGPSVEGAPLPHATLPPDASAPPAPDLEREREQEVERRQELELEMRALEEDLPPHWKATLRLSPDILRKGIKFLPLPYKVRGDVRPTG